MGRRQQVREAEEHAGSATDEEGRGVEVGEDRERERAGEQQQTGGQQLETFHGAPPPLFAGERADEVWIRLRIAIVAELPRLYLGTRRGRAAFDLDRVGRPCLAERRNAPADEARK